MWVNAATGREHSEVALRWKENSGSQCEWRSAASATPDPPLGGGSPDPEQPRGGEAAQPPSKKVKGRRVGIGPQSPPTAQVSTPLQSERKGRDHGEQGAQGPRSAAPGEEKPLFSAQTPRPGWRRGRGEPGVGSDPGPASTSACEPWSE